MARERSVSDVCEVLALRWSFRVIKHCLCSREICTVRSLYRPSTDGLISVPGIYRGSATRYFADSANRLRLQ